MQTIFLGCDNSQLIRDGYCNDEKNKIQCGFDGGDCCYSNFNITKKFCKDCSCLTGDFLEKFDSPLIGDGYCHDEINTAEYNYDGGDCCGSCVNKIFCTNCSCIGNVIGEGLPNGLIGDGFCNDETNNEDCNFDGGDCCGPNVNTQMCKECQCKLEIEGCFSSSDYLYQEPRIINGNCYRCVKGTALGGKNSRKYEPHSHPEI